MKCIKKNPHYKSTVEFFNNVAQTLSSTESALNLIGTEVTNTGIAINVNGNSVNIKYPGTYRLHASVSVDITTAGDITAQIYMNGVALPETLKTMTMTVGNSIIDIDTIRFINSNCTESTQMQLLIKTDGTAVGSVELLSGNVEKLA